MHEKRQRCQNCGQGPCEHPVLPVCRDCGLAYDWLAARRQSARRGDSLLPPLPVPVEALAAVLGPEAVSPPPPPPVNRWAASRPCRICHQAPKALHDDCCLACGAAYRWISARRWAAYEGRPLPPSPDWSLALPGDPAILAGQQAAEQAAEQTILARYAQELGWA